VLVQAALAADEDPPPELKRTHPCSWTSPGGAKFDLTELQRLPGEVDYVVENTKFDYYMNVCGDTEDIPDVCSDQEKEVSAPAFQVEKQGGNNARCYWLGDTESHTWSLIDDSRPNMGVNLVYKNGEKCSNKLPRQITYHFVCARGFSAGGSALFVEENKSETEHCHYNVTWPTIHGCPVDQQAAGSCATSTFDSLFYPGLSVVLWSAALYGSYFLYGSLGSLSKGGAGPALGQMGSKRQGGRPLIDDMLPDGNDFPEQEGLMNESM